MSIRRQFDVAILGLLLFLAGAGTASAHPHVWVTAKSEIVYAADGTVKAVRYAWTFDEMFSAFAVQGLDKDNDGKLTREELVELAKVNVTSLKEFDYFTVGRSAGKPIAFDEPVDYWLEADANKILTLHFTLPLKTTMKGNYTLDIFDPTWFIDFSLAEQQAVKLVDAPTGCLAELRRPETAATANLSESFFNSLNAASEFGSQFASRMTIRCQ